MLLRYLFNEFRNYCLSIALLILNLENSTFFESHTVVFVPFPKKLSSYCIQLFQVEDNSLEADTLGYFKYKVDDLVAADNMTVQRPFALLNSGSNSVLHLRMSLRVCDNNLYLPKVNVYRD